MLFLWNKIQFHLNSDMSSELLLGSILSKQHRFLTDQWFYSTELRVLNTQIIYRLIFAFSNNWRIVRCVSTGFMIVILLISFYYLMNQLGCKKSVPFLAPLLIWDYSNEYCEIVAKAPFYLPHICISFLTVGMICQCVRSVKKSQKRLLIFLMAVLALLAGLGGPRQIVVLYLPILISSVICFVIEKGVAFEKTQYMILCAVNFIFSVAGYFINVQILSKKYQFMNYDIHYKDFSLESLVEAFNGILRVLGYSDGKIFSFSTVLNGCMLLVIIMMAVSIYTGTARKGKTSYFDRLLSLYLLCALVIFISLYAFTDMDYTDRYNLPILIFVIPVIAVNMREIHCNQKVKKCICAFVISLVYVCGVHHLYELTFEDRTVQIREVTGYLLDKNVVNGYATFWNGNVMTELSNGEIEVWVTSSIEDLLRRNDNIFKWLQLTDHMDRKPEGKIFVLLTEEEYATCPKELLAQEEVAFSNTNYRLYIFNSYDEFTGVLEGHT